MDPLQRMLADKEVRSRRQRKEGESDMGGGGWVRVGSLRLGQETLAALGRQVNLGLTAIPHDHTLSHLL